MLPQAVLSCRIAKQIYIVSPGRVVALFPHSGVCAPHPQKANVFHILSSQHQMMLTR